MAANGEYIRVRLESTDVFQDFIAYLAKDTYKVLRNYKGLNGAQPQTYLTKVTNRFIFATFSRETRRIKREIGDDELIAVSPARGNPFEDINRKEQNKVRDESLVIAYARLQEKERLIVELFYGIRGMDKRSAKDLADLFRMKEKAVYKITEKFRRLLQDELKKRGIFDLG